MYFKQFAVFGNPINHSQSPILHNAVFRKYQNQLGFVGLYGRILLVNDNLKETFLNLNLSGANITLPFKEIAFNTADLLSESAKEIEAVNTLYIKNNQLIGDNSDAEGFYKCIEKYNYKTALILGAGGAAKAIAYILHKHNFDVILTNRTESKLEYFKKWRNIKTFSHNDLKFDKFDIVINTTNAGLKDDNLPLESNLLEQILNASNMAFDIIYGKETPFLSIAKKCNNITKDGLEMLINQAAISNYLFCEKKLNLSEIEHEMKKILLKGGIK